MANLRASIRVPAAPRTFYVGNLKGVGRVYQQTFIDTYAKVACAKLYDRKTPITAADLLNDRVIPFFDSHDKFIRKLHASRFTSQTSAFFFVSDLAKDDVADIIGILFLLLEESLVAGFDFDIVVRHDRNLVLPGIGFIERN